MREYIEEWSASLDELYGDTYRDSEIHEESETENSEQEAYCEMMLRLYQEEKLESWEDRQARRYFKEMTPHYTIDITIQHERRIEQYSSFMSLGRLIEEGIFPRNVDFHIQFHNYN